MCTEPLYAIRLKTEYDVKFQRFGKRTPIRVLKAVREIGKDTSKLEFDRNVYDLIMISCGQCMQCRLLRVKQRAVMSMCESLEHKNNCFITLTFGYPQTYSYYRHVKGLSHYLASKKANFHAWSLDVETWQKFMKRLRHWYYNEQLFSYLVKMNRLDLVYSVHEDKLIKKSHIRIPKAERDVLLADFKPQTIRVMHTGEYGSKRNRAHHHAILFGFQFPDLEEIYENGQIYYTSKILSELWPFGIHRIGKCEYNSCCYVARYVTKKINGNNMEEYYNGRKQEYVTYSTRPVLGANYFKKNFKEFAHTGEVKVAFDKVYKCPLPKSYDNILMHIDNDLYNQVKEKRVKDCVKDLDELLKQERSIYSKLDSGNKIAFATLRKLTRVFDETECPDVDEYLAKAKAFGINTKFFVSEFKDGAISLLNKKSYKDHKSKSSNADLHEKYYKFELARKRHISHCYDIYHSDKRVVSDLCFYINMPNPFKCVTRGFTLPDNESINENSYFDEKGKEYCYED